MESKLAFNARFVSATSLDRVYRIYVIGNDLYFIRIGGQGGIQEAVTHQFGFLGSFIGAFLKKRTEKKKEALIQNIDQMSPERRLAEHKHNFKLNSIEFQEGRIEPASSFAAHGPHVGRWNFSLRDGRKMNFQFEKNEDLQIALNALPRLLVGRLSVNGEWNESKKKFQRRKG
jgi:hypothetical protein